MTNSNFPFVFDAEKMKDLFKMPEFDKMFEQGKMPGVDFQAMVTAHQKNVAALVEANKAVMAGYQELYKRQVALVEQSLAQAKDQLMEVQGQPMNPEHASRNIEQLKASFDKIAADIRELTELAQQANMQAFNIMKSRFDEAVAEMRAAAENAQR